METVLQQKPYYNCDEKRKCLQLNTVFSKMLIIYSLLKMMINCKHFKPKKMYYNCINDAVEQTGKGRATISRWLKNGKFIYL